MGKIKELLGEIDNLKRELEYYLTYEPDNHTAIVEIEKQIFILEDKLNGTTL